jgi:electron transport complex protein RnfG
MSTPEEMQTHNIANNRLRGIMVLIIFAIVATLIINLAARKTRQDIAANQAAYAMQIIGEVLPSDGYNNEPHLDIIWLSDQALPGSQPPLPAYRARLDQQVTATVMTVIAEAGYVGPIKLLIGIDSRGNIIRVRVSEHRETPGLGDKIEPEKSAWINLFDGAGPGTEADWSLRQDGGKIDHISGATITSRAVVQAVQAALEYYLANSTAIHAIPAAPDTAKE